MPNTQKITSCLWFDNQAEEAVAFYAGIFRNSRILNISRYGEAGREIHGKSAGSVMTIAFELDGQVFTALNGGPVFKFNEAISFQVNCETKEEVDYYWESYPRVETKARSNAAGSRTNMACRGKWFPAFCPK
jgi:predicted 3-demethylubiquinone-9 3-methyltransferase (glyoxalase superfamily)